MTTRTGASSGASRLILAALILAGGIGLIYWRLVVTNRVLATGDAFTYFLPYRDFANASLREGNLPLWNPYLFLGVPFLANPQTAVLYPPHWLFIGIEPAKSLIASVVLHLWIAGLGMVIYLRRVAGLRWVPALVGGLLFALSGYLGAHVGQVNQVSAAAWLPWLLWLLEEATGNRWRQVGGVDHTIESVPGINLFALAGLALVIGIQLLAGHSQASFINLVGTGIAALWPGIVALGAWAGRRIQKKPAPFSTTAFKETGVRLVVLASAVILGLLISAVQLLPTLQLTGQSVRSAGLPYREVVSFSLQPRGLLLSLLPTYGENLADRFGTPAFSEYLAFVGVTGVVLAMLAILNAARGKRDQTILSPMGLATAFVFLGIFLGFGLYNPVYYLLYLLVPGFDLFRAPARWMLLYTAGVSVLAAYGVQGLSAALPRAGGLSDGMRQLTGKRRLLFVILVILTLAFLVLQKWPNLLTLVLWVIAGGLTLFFVAWPRLARWRAALLIILILGELALASLSLNHARPTAPEAVTSLRTAPAHLLAANQQAVESGRLPGRFLSMSGITYDPGDLAEIERIYAGQLPEQAIYDLVVATKLQEIVAPNLALLWRLPGVDGYGGGVLPLQRFVQLQSLLLPEGEISADGRLREQLHTVPPSRLLRLLGVDHVITDKGFDAWVDGVYYDLELSTELEPGEQVEIDVGNRLESTRLGLFSHIQEGESLPENSPVAEVSVVTTTGDQRGFILVAGRDSAEGEWTSASNHAQPQVRQPWSHDSPGWDYLASLEFAQPAALETITVRSMIPEGDFVLRGISLIDDSTDAHAALTLPADGGFRRVHSGDVKVYENLQTLPRAYVVHKATIVADDGAALESMAQPDFEPGDQAVLVQGDLEASGLLDWANSLTGKDGLAHVTPISYEPERVIVETTLESPGLLILGDTWYDGWHALVDGAEAPILKANYLFRGIALDQGSHRVELVFQPESLRTGAIITGLGYLLLGGLLIAGLLRRYGRR
ncbi:MAG: YfhO family protein [Chloroflexota bacterium]|nr:YfhO family protein [Chloroflexota bacterium]